MRVAITLLIGATALFAGLVLADCAMRGRNAFLRMRDQANLSDSGA